jgi:hypothetical protein
MGEFWRGTWRRQGRRKAFSRSRTAGISLEFASTATCPSIVPMPCARAATECGAFFPSLPFVPGTALGLWRRSTPETATISVSRPADNPLTRAPSAGRVPQWTLRDPPGRRVSGGLGPELVECVGEGPLYDSCPGRGAAAGYAEDLARVVVIGHAAGGVPVLVEMAVACPAVCEGSRAGPAAMPRHWPSPLTSW